MESLMERFDDYFLNPKLVNKRYVIVPGIT